MLMRMKLREQPGTVIQYETERQYSSMEGLGHMSAHGMPGTPCTELSVPIRPNSSGCQGLIMGHGHCTPSVARSNEAASVCSCCKRSAVK